ncbi:MAG: RIP metalloprotease RseP [Beijerinckiaceae bacterium]|nr:RIP metalloprotease RseP [Beijerinckiaceae bacterium]MCI0747002.1 RIP metalloprotease RseP [Limisphaerales bacterium]
MSVLTYVWSLAGYILPFLFVLSLVVFFHELGHFLIGRWCGVKVEAFSLGFGPELFGFNDRYGTHWRVAALPLGGYVKFHGDANGTSMPDEDAVAAMTSQEREVSFVTQKVWKRAAIVAAGPIANFILAVAIYTGIFYVHGRPILLPMVDSVAAGSAAEAAGFQPGDLILSIDGTKVESFEDMQRIVQAASDTQQVFGVERAGKFVELVATPRRRDVVTPFGTTRVGVLGVQSKAKPENWHVQNYGLIDSVRLAGTETWYIIARTGSYLKGLVAGEESADQLSGPIRIAEVSGAMAKIGLAALLNLAAILSISVGMLNLLPIPLLDGGHLVYYAVEAVRGKAMNERTQQFGFKIGIMLVTSLMIFATYNDILRLTRQLMHWG